MSVKDDPLTELWLGNIVPAAIVLLMILNVIRGEVYFPELKRYGGSWQTPHGLWVFTSTLHVSGALLMKGALAGMLTGEFKYRNHDATSNLGAIVIMAGLATFLIGAVLFPLGFL